MKKRYDFQFEIIIDDCRHHKTYKNKTLKQIPIIINKLEKRSISKGSRISVAAYVLVDNTCFKFSINGDDIIIEE